MENKVLSRKAFLFEITYRISTHLGLTKNVFDSPEVECAFFLNEKGLHCLELCNSINDKYKDSYLHNKSLELSTEEIDFLNNIWSSLLEYYSGFFKISKDILPLRLYKFHKDEEFMDDIVSFLVSGCYVFTHNPDYVKPVSVSSCPSSNLSSDSDFNREEVKRMIEEDEIKRKAELASWMEEQLRRKDYVDSLKAKRRELDLTLLTLDKGTASYNDVLDKIICISKEIRSLVIKGE